MSADICGANGGQGIGAGHVCVCNAPKGHPPIYGRGHGCSCGAIWSDPAPEGESVEVKIARHAVASADPALLAAAKALAAERSEEWDELNVMRQCERLWTARDAVSAAYNATFSPENVARVVSATGVSLQTVTEVARELRKA